MCLLLAWSPVLDGRELSALLAWAHGKAGQEMYRVLKEELRRVQDPVNIALFIGALAYLERLKHYERGEACQSAADHLLNFVLLLDGSSSRSAQKSLEDMSYLYHTIASSLLEASELKIITHLLSQYSRPPELVSPKACQYWRTRLEFTCSHLDALRVVSIPSRRSSLESQEQKGTGKRRLTN